MCPFRKVWIFTITFSPISILASTVADPICGKRTVLGALSKSLLTAGSLSKTSNQAPAIWPFFSNFANASSSITFPLEVFIMYECDCRVFNLFSDSK